MACTPDKPVFKAIDLTGADYALGFELPDQNGQKRTLADFKGKVVVVFFGYTQCPDFCPTTLSEWVQVKKALADKGELLKAYMANFDPSFLALIPPVSDLPELAKSFKVYYKKIPLTGSADSYTMDHSAGTYVYDTSGRLRLYARYGLGPTAMAADIAQLLK